MRLTAIELAREAGARKVYFASAAPPVRYPNVYGIDMPVAGELVASDRSEEDIAAFIGADWLIYQDLDDLVAACRHDDARITEFDTSCFSGHYVTADVTAQFLARLEHDRSDGARAQRMLDLPGGRTARAGNKGMSIALVDPKEKWKIPQLETKLRVSFSEYRSQGGL